MLQLSYSKCVAAVRAVSKVDMAASMFKAVLLTFALLPLTTEAGEQKLIRVSTAKSEGKTAFYVENLQHADVTVTLEMELSNFTPSEEVPSK